jgi:N-acetylglucosamine-6-sulfatase
MRRYLVTAVLCVSVFALVSSTAVLRAAARSGLPNVVLIMTDDMRYDDLDYMPHVQRLLVEKGTTFTSFFSQNPMCCPARASMLRGQYSHTTGVVANGGERGGFSAFEDSQTLPVWLDRNYETALVGKYLNHYGPGTGSQTYTPPGWDTWMASLGNATYDYTGMRLNVNGEGESFPGRHSTRLIGDLSKAFLASQDQPFFLYSAFVAPHGGGPREAEDSHRFGGPFVPARYRDTYRGPPFPADPSFNEADISDKRRSAREKPPLSIDQLAAIAESYAQRREALAMVDHQVNRLFATLRERGLLHNTYVIFLSDNGYLAGEHRIVKGKGLPYAPASHVPLVIRGPGIAAGSTDDTLTMTPDLAPTVLSLTGQRSSMPSWYAVDGLDVFSAKAKARRVVVLETATTTGRFAFRGILTSDGWKYVVFTDPATKSDEVEMYDLDSDPYELHNLAADPAYDAKQRELEALYERYKSCSGAACR